MQDNKNIINVSSLINYQLVYMVSIKITMIFNKTHESS
jgi:hypothetical protein